MKKYIALFTAAVIAAALTGCTSDNAKDIEGTAGDDIKNVNPVTSDEPVRPTDNNGEMGIFGGEDFTGDENAVLGGETVQIPNPLIEYKTLADAEAAAGFDFAVPDEIDGNKPTSYVVIDGSGIIEVTYGDNAVSLRKAAGSGDISGDCNSYTEIGAGVGDVSVTLRENDEKVFSAIWENDGYTYALYSADGISENTATTAISAAK